MENFHAHLNYLTITQYLEQYSSDTLPNPYTIDKLLYPLLLSDECVSRISVTLLYVRTHGNNRKVNRDIQAEAKEAIAGKSYVYFDAVGALSQEVVNRLNRVGHMCDIVEWSFLIAQCSYIQNQERN